LARARVKVRVKVDRRLSSNTLVRLWVRVKVRVRVKVERWLFSNARVRLWAKVRVKVRARVKVDRRISFNAPVRLWPRVKVKVKVNVKGIDKEQTRKDITEVLYLSGKFTDEQIIQTLGITVMKLAGTKAKVKRYNLK
jgi:hypothetical protein